MFRSGAAPRCLTLFAYEWDAGAFGGLARRWPSDHAGFDLFSFPSNVRLANFDLERFTERLATRSTLHGWRAVVSHHEQFGALAAALLAERMGWPGTPVEAVLACQHKLHARRVLEAVRPDANPRYFPLEISYGDPVPEGLDYPLFVKPIKAAFSVLAKAIDSRAELHRHTRFGAWELWVIRHLVEPFERIARRRLPDAGSAHRMMVEAPVSGRQYNLDGYVCREELRVLGFADAVMYPGTQSFMRFQTPSRLDSSARMRAVGVARDFLRAIGFTHGFFNMEFCLDPATGRLTVIEFNPRLASQFGDLYRRVLGADAHEMSLALAHGLDPARLPLALPSAGAAASFVYRTFPGDPAPVMPDRRVRKRLAARFPDALLSTFPRTSGQVARDFKWLGSHRHAILHLGGRDACDLRERCIVASALLGWRPPYAAFQRPRAMPASAGLPLAA